MPSDPGIPGPGGTVPDVLAPATLGPVTLRNRVIKSATFEHRTPGGLVSQDLIDYHLAVAEGGVGMTTVAYCAVSREGRTDRNQLYWRPEALPGLRRLTDTIHATGAKVAAQIGHAGPVANAGQASFSASRRFNPQSLRFDRAPTADDLRRFATAHADAAEMARDTGFDCVEIHLGHNYLASSFLSPRLNHRKDAWGGSPENRARFPRMLAEAVRERVGTSIAVTAKLNMDDGARGGFRPAESVPFAQLLEADGHLDAIELTGGSSLLNPMFLFRGDPPLREFAAAQPPLTRLGLRLGGGALFKTYPYEPLYFLETARLFRAALRMPLILLGGITDRPGMDTAMREGFEFVAMARALLREPDLVRKISADRAAESLCTHCNLCVPTIYSRTHCPLVTS